MSHACNSALPSARPRPEGDGGDCCARATAPNSPATTSATALPVHVSDSGDRRESIGNLAIAVDPPRLNPITVPKLTLDRRVYLLSREAPEFRKFQLGRLNLTFFVNTPRLQHRFFAVP